MKRVLVVNPVTTEAFKENLKPYLEELTAGTDLIADLAHLGAGPASVETLFDEGFAVPGVLELIARSAGRYDGFVVNCFADPGVEAARELVDVPVVGPAEASMFLATTLGHKFAVVSTFRNSGPWVERQARALGLESRLAWATGVEVPVLALNKDPHATTRLIVEAAREAIERHGAEVIVLGCTGMARLARTVREELNRARPGRESPGEERPGVPVVDLGVPVVEPFAAALRTLEALLDLGLSHSKAGIYGGPGRGEPRPGGPAREAPRGAASRSGSDKRGCPA